LTRSLIQYNLISIALDLFCLTAPVAIPFAQALSICNDNGGRLWMP
jgi:hypothetical protein